MGRQGPIIGVCSGTKPNLFLVFTVLLLLPDDLDHVEIPQDGIRKSRSHSFSSSVKNLFRRRKKSKSHLQPGGPAGGDPYPHSSRESSVSRASGVPAGAGRGGGYDPAFAQPSPDMSSRDVSVRHSPELTARDYPQYSSSVPAHAPIYDR